MSAESSAPPFPAHSLGIDLLKAAAALLIINSHLEFLYPRPWMSVDGLLGNTIFFFTTGYALTGSLARHPDETFLRFMSKRLLRLYPAVWIVLLLFPPYASPPHADVSSLHSAFFGLIYPTPLTFIQLIVPFYPCFYVLMRWKPDTRFLLLLTLVLMAVTALLAGIKLSAMNHPVVWSDLGYTWNVHYAATMVAGAAFWKWQRQPASGGWPYVATGALMALYLLLRACATTAVPAGLSQALRPILFAVPAVCLIMVGQTLRLLDDTSLGSFWMQTWVRFPIFFLSAYTWELYLLHLKIAHLPFASAADFPFNIILVFAATFAMAPLLHLISTPRKIFRKS